jgi:hypothetical protein
MFIEPTLMLDDALLNERLKKILEEKESILSKLQTMLGCTDLEQTRKKLSSNPQFAAVLAAFGVTVPTKLNSKGKTVPALAKKDEGFIELQESEDVVVQQLVAARLGVKSTIEESRINRFIDIGRRNKGFIPIPLKYYGAHTGRWSGSDAINLQNIPTRDKAKRTLKESIIAPPGFEIINADSSQIEARVLAWLSGQRDLVSAFRERRDVYSEFATKVFKRPITREDAVERFVGKTCFAGGTQVLTDSGLKPIDKITLDDRVWDGIEWVTHGGVICQGEKEVIFGHGIAATKDHEILTEHGWREWQEVQSESHLFQSALSLGNLPSSNIGEQKVPRPVERSLVYDLLSAGPRHRFMVLTDKGPIIASNCILGLGYGTGAEKLRHTLSTTPPGAEFTRDQCQKFVDVYRYDNTKIKELWWEGEQLLNSLMSWPKDVLVIDFGQRGVVHADSRGIRLPNNLYIRYSGLRIKDGCVTHDSRKGPRSIWGGVVVENVIQGLARVIIGDQMVEISSRYRVALTVHDSIVCVVPKKELDNAREFIEATMSRPPIWASDLPLACEIKHGESYGQT